MGFKLKFSRHRQSLAGQLNITRVMAVILFGGELIIAYQRGQICHDKVLEY